MKEQLNIPVYEVKEVSLEQAILLIASEQEKEQTIYKESAERMLQLVAQQNLNQIKFTPGRSMVRRCLDRPPLILFSIKSINQTVALVFFDTEKAEIT